MSKRERSENLWAWLFILPTILGLVVLNIYPIFGTIYQSFFQTGDFGRGNIFIGLENYQTMLRNPVIWRSLRNTIVYTAIEVPVSIAISMVLAVFLNGKIFGRGLFRTIFFLPMVAAPAAVAMVWRWLYNSEFGLLNQILGVRIHWISDPRIAIISLAVIGIWSIVGFNMILFLAGLQEIPRDYYEASSIDGATGIYQFFKITLPLISPMIFFVTVTRVIAGLQIFDLMFMVINRNNPAFPSTQSIVYLFYQYSFLDHNRGMGSAIVFLLLIVIMIVTVAQIIAQKKWVHYG